jgi:predicted nucleic acid-binding protein
VAVLIDTDVVVDLERGAANTAAEQSIGSEDRAISVVTVSQVLHGVYRAKGARRTRRSAFVEHLLAEMQAIPITETVARVHADVWASLAARGQVIGAHDLWIAATAIAHGLGIATGNAEEFERVLGLRVIPVPA